MSDQKSAPSSAELLKLAIQKELSSIDAALSIAGVESTDVKLTAEQLDREMIEDNIQKELQDAFKNNSVNVVAAALRTAHEAARARRDLQILETSHKRLLLGCYRILYQRKLKLENKLRSDNYV